MGVFCNKSCLVSFSFWYLYILKYYYNFPHFSAVINTCFIINWLEHGHPGGFRETKDPGDRQLRQSHARWVYTCILHLSVNFFFSGGGGSVVNPDPVGSGNFCWIRNHLCRIRIRQKFKKIYKQSKFRFFFAIILHKFWWIVTFWKWYKLVYSSFWLI